MTTSSQIRRTYFFLTQIHLRVRRCCELRRERRDLQKEYKKLAELPEYLLRDTGIKRSDINLKLNKPFWWS